MSMKRIAPSRSEHLKVALLGASLTQQYISHKTKEPTGYSYFLDDLLKSLYQKNYELKKFAYPGSRFELGAWLHYEAILDFNPDLLLLEISIEDCSQRISIGQRQRDYVHFFQGLMKRKILIGCLLLDHELSDPMLNNLILDICDHMKIPVQLVHQKDVETEDSRFEGVHTNSESAQLLFNAWKPFILNMLKLAHSTISWSDRCFHLSDRLGPPRLQYSHAKSFCSFEESVSVTSLRADFTFDASEAESVSFAVALLSLIGPHSSNLDATADGCDLKDNISKVSLFDKHCYYVRPAIKLLVLGTSTASPRASLIFRSEQDSPDTSILKKQPELNPSYPFSLLINSKSRLLVRSSHKLQSCVVTV